MLPQGFHKNSQDDQPKGLKSSPLPAYKLLSHNLPFRAALRKHKIIFFIDFDGTLAPIVRHPKDAILPAMTQQLLKALGDRFPVFIVSGRARSDLKQKVNLDNVEYFGCHGLDIKPPFLHSLPKRLQESPSLVKKVKSKLLHLTNEYPGSFLEDKHYTLALHYRLLSEPMAQDLSIRLRAIVASQPQLRIQQAKKVWEILPKEPWDKGKIVDLVLQQNRWQEFFPIYMGDDLPDEPGFRSVNHGAGILVCDQDKPTSATYQITDTNAVTMFLTGLLQLSQEMM